MIDGNTPQALQEQLAFLRTLGPQFAQGFFFSRALTADKIELGRRLFFDRRLSADGSLSCASCHRPDRAFSDLNSLRIADRTLPEEVFLAAGARENEEIVPAADDPDPA